jgi:hypothetical protein
MTRIVPELNVVRLFWNKVCGTNCGTAGGCLVALADMDPAQVNALPDVQAIARLSENRSGRGDLALLDCLGRFGSIREIAAAQHMHHSSVADRLAKIGEILGYDPRTPEGQYRARTALLLWHLHAHLPGPKKQRDAITAAP